MFSCCNHLISDVIFLQLYFCIFWHVVTSVLRNYLFVFCLFFCFFILYMYLRACLIFCSDFLFYLIVFCRYISHIYMFCFSAGCCRCHFLDLSDFLCNYFPVCCFDRPFIIFTSLLPSCFVVLQLFLMFVLTFFVLDFSALQIGGLNKFALVRFRFVSCRCSFFPPTCV